MVKQNCDVQPAVRTNLLSSLVRREDKLMKYRTMKMLDVDTEDLSKTFRRPFEDLHQAAACISTMIFRGDIVTQSGYELASSERPLTIKLYPEARAALDSPDLPELACCRLLRMSGGNASVIYREILSF